MTQAEDQAAPAATRKSSAKKAARKTAKKKTVRKTDKKAVKKKTSLKPAKKAAKKKAVKKSAMKAARTPAKDRREDVGSPKSLFEDFDALSEYLTQITGKSQEVVREFFTHHADLRSTARRLAADPLNVSEAFREMMASLAADPATLMERQFDLWRDYANLMAAMSRKMAGEDVEDIVKPDPGDKRFEHPAWTENQLLDFIKQSYLTFARWLRDTVQQLEGMDEHDKKKAEFFTQQFINAFSPSNFAMLNPEVIEATVESRGENLLKGLKNLLEDIDRGHGSLAIRQADLDYFSLGGNIATTPGKVVYQNDIMQLIQYDPMTETVAKRPLVIFPPWINKFYILDLQPGNSFIRWMVEQGRTVFVVSWVNPGPELREKTFFDYIKGGVFDALDAVEKATDERNVDAIGYCIGGTMLAAALAYMAGEGDKRIKSATFLTAQTDFTESGDLQLFVDDEQLEAIEKQMDAAGGVLEGRAMASTFNMLRSNDLIWSFVIDNYLKGKDPAKFDLLFWNSDATRMPKNVHLFYLREFYQHNRLAKREMVLGGRKLNLADVKIPIFMQAGETDHIAPHQSVYNSAKLFGGPVEYMLAGSGHIAGVINHPRRNKYHYSMNPELPKTLEDWKADAERRDGSWWPHWIEWLNRVSPEKTAAGIPGAGNLKIIEDAPGSYVKVKA
ncbi:MAG: PHA/PHB synthase family protein [Parvularculaceae bacterium]